MTQEPNKHWTPTQKWIVGGALGFFLIFIAASLAFASTRPPPNMKISVVSNICWSGSVGGTGGSSTKDGCGSDSWNFPKEKIVSAAVQLENKCSLDPYTYQETCESGSLQVIIFHTNGSICNQASTTARYGLADASCSE